VQLNTSFLTFLGLDWLNAEADVFVCRSCGRLEWFLDVDSHSDVAAAESIECPSCGETIPPDKSACSKCGWSYEPMPPDATEEHFRDERGF